MKATRAELTEDKSILDTWTKGPDFLYEPEEKWRTDLPWIINDAELRVTSKAQVLLRQDHSKTDWYAINFNQEDLPSLTVIKGKLLEWIKAAQTALCNGIDASPR